MRSKTALEFALEYVAYGYAVIPLYPCSKRPRLKEWPKKAATTPAQVERMWRTWPDSGVGLMPPKGCIVVDVDPRNGGTESLATLDIPRNTPTQRTGGGGWHFVVRFEGDTTRLPKRPGIDYIIRGKKFFVAEPSIHPSGAVYEWEKGKQPS